MANKFRCGRLVIKKDGLAEKLPLPEGGGTRDCTISHIDIGFEEIHDRLREIYGLAHTNIHSKLYDFERKELDQNRYTTFYEYIQRNGLKFNGTLLYLCTLEANENVVNPSSSEKRRTTQPIQNPGPIIRKIIPQVEADSSTSPVVIKTDPHPRIINEPIVHHNHTTEGHRMSSYSNYSFEKSLNELIDYLRPLIGQYNRESMLIHLFEYICTIQGLSSIILDGLKQQNQFINEHEKSIYNHGLDKIEKLSRLIKTLIELNKMKISNIDQYSVIINSFDQFHRNFNTLRDQWFNNRTSRSYTSRNDTTSSRYHSETDSRKRIHSSNHRSSYRISDEEDINEKYSLFKNLLKSFDNLLDVLHQRRFTSFYHLVECLLREIKEFRSNIKLSDPRSLHDGEELIISIERRLTNRINGENHYAAPHGIDIQLQYPCDKVLGSMKELLDSLEYYKSKINQHKRSRPIPTETKPIVHRSSQQKPRIDDDQSSEASHSSVGDEVLEELARDAYEKRPNHFK